MACFTLSKKSMQRYTEAFRAMTEDYPVTERRYYLRDISKTHYTEDLLLTALCNYRCSFSDIPPELRTKEICLCAVAKDAENIRYVPEEHRSYDMMLHAVSAHPEVLDTALYMYRLHRGVMSADAPYSREDLTLMLEAARPLDKAKDAFESSEKDSAPSKKESFEVFAAKHCGETRGIPSIVVAKRLF